MRFSSFSIISLCYSSSVWAGPVSTASVLTTSSALLTDCVNTPYSRNCWGQFNTLSNYYDEAPDTGVTREYWFELTNTTAAPDGISRPVLLVNGSLPGPTIEADWGDTVIVHLHNAMQNNGSTIHFHGVRQNFTNPMDGVASISQCPISPGETYTYKWRATQYGTSWYHSHWGVQAWEGVFGGIVINGPATQNYDEDKGVMFLNDWTHQTVDELWYYAEEHGTFTMDNGLINGTNTNETVGSRLDVEFISGTTYRLRLINAALDTHFKFSIDQHQLTVIAMDFVAIEPFTVPFLSIGMGQRYDILVTANQPSQNYWLRAIPQSTCSDNDNTDNIKAIVRYEYSSTVDPTTEAYEMPDDCDDELMASLVPALPLNVGTTFTDETASATLSLSEGYFRWEIAPGPMQVEWNDPSLLQIYNNATHWNSSENIIELLQANAWVFLVIQNTNSVAHPIHLHGHDFYVLAQSTGIYTTSSTISTNNPPRRDVAMLPGSGYMVIAFLTDNPGAWLLHCHIGLHAAMGFALQFIEREPEIRSLIDYDTLSDTCDSWTSYATSYNVEEDDSGV